MLAIIILVLIGLLWHFKTKPAKAQNGMVEIYGKYKHRYSTV